MDHGQRRALADEPAVRRIAVGVLPALQRVPHQVEALLQAVAAVVDVVLERSDADARLAGANDIPPPEFDRVHADAARQLVDRGLDREAGLRLP